MDIIEFYRLCIENNKYKPERLTYIKAADKFIKGLQDIVGMLTDADTIKKALELKEKIKAIDRIVLIEVSIHTSNFKAVEVRSTRWPFSWNSVVEYMHVFELIAYFTKNLHDQEKVMRMMVNEQRGLVEVKSTTVSQLLKSALFS
ncbi:3097_t:CDS:2, partial [Scutellospora calospora]